MIRPGVLRMPKRLYSSPANAPKDQKAAWFQLNKVFTVPAVQNGADPRIDIAPRLQPRFPPGQTVYDSSDFSMAKRRYEMTARNIASLEGTSRVDRFVKLGVDPLELWKSPSALSEFITGNGKIMPGWVLGNKGKSQKKLAKAIRRCRAAGLLSTVHRSVFDST